MKVVFVNMPFAGIRPAIGVSLLQARLQAAGVEASTLYPNMRFARRIGVASYEYIAERAPIPSLAGDWVFSATVFGDRPDAERAYLDGYVNRFGCSRSEVRRLLDARAAASSFLDELVDGVDWAGCDVVGFTSTFTQNLASLALAYRIKQRHPNVIVVFGGANCEGQMGLALLRNFQCIDYVCCGEADVTFPALVAALRAGQSAGGVAGVGYRRNGGLAAANRLQPDLVRDLNALPIPDYDDYFAELATWPPPTANRKCVLMESSRGCWWGEPHHCTFCGLNGATMAYRSKTADRVLRELATLAERYQPAYVEMVDNILDMQYFRDLLPALRKLELDLSLFFEVKANLTKDQIRLLRAAGVRTIQPGIESFSNEALTRMRKGTTALQNVQLLKWCKEIGVQAYWNLLYGFPGEDPFEYQAMADLIPSLAHLQPPHAVGAIRLDRFSPYFVDASLGACNIRPDRSYPLVYALPDSELSEIAYYFEFDYADGRDPNGYAKRVRTAVGSWHQNKGGRLISIDHGSALAIWDLRPGAARTITVLEGDMREAYLFCDRHRSRRSLEAMLAARGWDADSITTLIDGWLRDRLLLQVGDRVLGLAVPEPIRPDKAAERPAW